MQITEQNNPRSLEPIRFGLAPMEGVTDIAVRLWFALTAPPDFVWTPFLRVTDTFPSAKIPHTFIPEQTILRGAVPFAVIPQLMGSRPEDFVRVATAILDDVPFVDLNCGCPSPTVVGSRAGSSLLERVDVFHSFIDTVINECGPRRVSVKMRTGFHDAGEFSILIGSIRSMPLAQLAVHGRTRPQRYTGQSDWQKIRHASEEMTAPVVGSGDIVHRESAHTLLRSAPRVKTVIVGRGALRNPWLFGDISEVPLIEPLIAFGLMQQLGLHAPERLLRWAESGGAARSAGGNPDYWRSSITQLLAAADMPEQPLSSIEIDPRSFARVKMLWNYLRSSLPPVFMEPTLLRARSLGDFVQHLSQIVRLSELDAKVIPLRYRQDLDWIYSGQGKVAPSTVEHHA